MQWLAYTEFIQATSEGLAPFTVTDINPVDLEHIIDCRKYHPLLIFGKRCQKRSNAAPSYSIVHRSTGQDHSSKTRQRLSQMSRLWTKTRDCQIVDKLNHTRWKPHPTIRV